MTGKTLLRIALALWALAFVGAFAQFGLVPPTGDGFTRGLNRVLGFFGWQAAAAVLAVVVWFIGNGFPTRSLGRRASRVPAAAAGLIAAGVLGIVLYASLANPRPTPDQPATPPTVPAPG